MSVMTTEKFEVFSLEEGDTIIIQGVSYMIVAIEDGDTLDYRLVLVDEEGYRRSIEADATARFRVVCEAAEDVL